MKLKPYALLVIIFLLPYVFMCGQHEESGYTIEIVEGVKHIHNYTPLWGDTLKVELEFVQKIGEWETKDDNYMFYPLSAVAKDSKGNIYILDSGNYRIQKFDSNGKYLATIGRQGQGPGEFELPVLLDIDAQGNIYVVDLRGSKIHVFTPEGKYIKTNNVSLQTIREFHVIRSGNIVFNTRHQDAARAGAPFSAWAKLTPMIKIFNHEGNQLREFLEPIDFGSPLLNMNDNTIYTAVDPQDNIYLTFLKQNRIEKYTPDGTCIFTANRVLNYKVRTTVVTNDEYGNPRIIKDAGTVISVGIGIDHKNRIWVPTYMKQAEPTNSYGKYRDKLHEIPDNLVFQIYDNEGIWLSNILCPVRFSRMRIIGDRIYFIGIEQISLYEYKIIEK